MHFKDRYFFSIFDVKIAISFFYVLSIRTNQQQQHPIIHMKYLTRKVFFHRITLSSSYIDCCCFCNFFLLLSLHSLHPFRAKKKTITRENTQRKKNSKLIFIFLTISSNRVKKKNGWFSRSMMIMMMMKFIYCSRLYIIIIIIQFVFSVWIRPMTTISIIILSIDGDQINYRRYTRTELANKIKSNL